MVTCRSLQVHLHDLRQGAPGQVPGVRARDPRREGDTGRSRQPERDHPAGGAGRRALPRGVAPPGRRAPPRAEEEEEDGEEGSMYPNGAYLPSSNKGGLASELIKSK